MYIYIYIGDYPTSVARGLREAEAAMLLAEARHHFCLTNSSVTAPLPTQHAAALREVCVREIMCLYVCACVCVCVCVCVYMYVCVYRQRNAGA